MPNKTLMSLSTKKIIKSIEGLPEHFSRNDLYKQLDLQNQNRDGKRRKNSKKKKNISAENYSKSVWKADEIFKGFIDIGLIERHKNKFRKKKSFIIDGTIKINKTGNSILNYNNTDIIIKKNDIGDARNDDTVSVKVFDYYRGLFYARVIQVTGRKKNNYTGRVILTSGDYYIIRLLDTPGDIEVCSRRNDTEIKAGYFVTITLTNAYNSGRPECIINEFFPDDNEKFDFIRIKHKYSLPESYTALKDTITIPEVSHDEIQGRKDYTKLFTITIDGDTAKDFDDAISIKEYRNYTKLYVHIADVSAYIASGSDIDNEACNRGTSYYLGDSVIPMLPEELSNELCSLKEGVNRLTLTAEMNFDRNGNLLDFKSFRGIIKVNKRLTYIFAEEILDSGLLKISNISKNLKKMFHLAKTLYSKRVADGRLDLNLSDEEVIYENGRVKEIRFSRRLKSQMLIEEFMLSANEAVSKALKDNNIPSLYRIHERISDDNLVLLQNFLTVLNIKINPNLPAGKGIQEILQKVSGKPYEQVVNLVVLKSMMQAFYGPEPLGHFGLGFMDYTHFTSPIRRYPDLIVHRCLKSLMDSSKPAYTLQQLEVIGKKSSTMERVAQKAERDFVKIKTCRLMKDRIGEEFQVIISGLAKFGIFVTLIDSPVEGMIPLKNLTDDYYILKEDEYTIIGRRLNRRFRLGDRINARLATVDIETLKIDFELIPTKKKNKYYNK